MYVKAVGTDLCRRVLDSNGQSFDGRVQGQGHKEAQGAGHGLGTGFRVAGVADAGVGVLDTSLIAAGCAVGVIVVMIAARSKYKAINCGAVTGSNAFNLLVIVVVRMTV